MFGGGLGTYVVSALRSKLGLNKGYVEETLVGLLGGDTYVESLVQEYLMENRKELVELRGGGSGTTTIMKILTI